MVTHVLTLFLVTIIHPLTVVTYVTHVLTLLLYLYLKFVKDSYDED